jgi:type II secretory pathway pseudopilin PulG
MLWQSPKAYKVAGFNLIESAIVLALIGIVIGGIWVAAASVAEDRKVRETLEGVTLIAENIRRLISVADSSAIGSSYDLTNTAISAKMLPENWISGSAAKNPFGGSVFVFNASAGSDFDIRLYGLPSSVCTRLISRVSVMGGTDRKYGPHAVATYIGGVLNVYISTFPISPATAAAACSGSVNYFRFRFYYTRIN